MAEDVCSTLQSPIEAHGIIGDMRSAALVADDGSVDFMCWPDFDSPTLFTALLDCDRAGVFELAPNLPNARRQQIYLPDSNVLQTRWVDKDAVVEITDFMPIPAERYALPRLVRRVEVRNGSATIRLRCRVRHDYSRADTVAGMAGDDVRFEAPGQPTVRLSATQTLHVEQHSAMAQFDLREGESAEWRRLSISVATGPVAVMSMFPILWG